MSSSCYGEFDERWGELGDYSICGKE